MTAVKTMVVVNISVSTLLVHIDANVKLDTACSMLTDVKVYPNIMIFHNNVLICNLALKSIPQESLHV